MSLPSGRHPEPFVADAPQGKLREGSAVPTLSPHALRLRNTALGTLSRRARRPAPTPTELTKIRDDLDLRDAWSWWSGQELPTQAVRAVSRAVTRKRTPFLRATILTLLASGAWLLTVSR
jgi:hypothetical protein